MMERKAFLFHYEQFEEELKPILEAALASGDRTALVRFIDQYLPVLSGPDDGEPLPAEWEAMIESRDAHQYGEFSLTKHYDGSADIGLGASWEEIQELVSSDPGISSSPILGKTIGPPSRPFDPGRMGSYFQTPDEVAASHEYLMGLARQTASDKVPEAIRMLEEALRAKKGLYVTF